MRKTTALPGALAFAILAWAGGCESKPAPEGPAPGEPTEAEGGSGLLELPADPADYQPIDRYDVMGVPADNPITAEKATLGWHLYFDPRLSGDGKRSCYGCHLNEKGLTDGLPLAIGAFDKMLTRSSPTMWNIGFHQTWYWDGRAKTLEAQASAAWKGANMGAGARLDEILAEINAIPSYKQRFEQVFGGPATADNVPQALATYMRTIVSYDTPFDRWQKGDESAVSDAAKRGHKVFEKAGCATCHGGVLFTDLQFHNVGIGMSAENPDLGRYVVTKREEDKGAFKTPTLRDVADSGPWFHDGSIETLEDAVRLMAKGGLDNPWLDKTSLKPAALTNEEIADLIAFLEALDEPTELKIPELP